MAHRHARLKPGWLGVFVQARARIAGGLSSSQDTDAVKLYLPGPKRLSHSLTKEFHYEATPQTRGPLLVLQGQLAELLKLMQTGGYDQW